MKRTLAILLLVLCAAGAAFAQPHVRLPDASQRATVGQTVGITDITMTYHRPGVNKRTIFGGLVPYDVLWRAGANENTLVTFSTPVSVEGQPLPAGTYSFFIMPKAQGPWTVVFNKFTGGWGTYNYDQSEDAIRVNVTPQMAADSQERLVYTFDEPTATSTMLTMRWDKTRLPIKITVDTPNVVLSSIRSELRSGKHWDAAAYVDAARYAANNNDMADAVAWVNRAVEMDPDYSTLSAQARILDKKGDAAAAKAARDRANTMAPSYADFFPAYRLLGDKKYDEAIAWANKYAADHPDSWRAVAFLGTVYGQKGDKAAARAAFDKAMSMAPTMAEKVEVQDSINDLAAEQKM